MKARELLSVANDVLETAIPFLLWIMGLILIADAVSDNFNRLTLLVSEPDLFLFILGIMILLAGRAARQRQKEMRRLEKSLRRAEEESRFEHPPENSE